MSQTGSMWNQTLSTESPGLLEQVTGVWRFERSVGHAGQRLTVASGIVHLVTAGAYRLRINEEVWEIGAGDLVLYLDGDRLEWLETLADVRFLSVGYVARGIDVVAGRPRVRPASAAVREAFKRVVTIAETGSEVRLQAAVLELLGAIMDDGAKGGLDERWRRVEEKVRREQLYHLSLDELAAMAHCSRATLVRVCRAETGESPHRRLRQLRLEEAASLLRASHLTVGEIAEHLRYPRIHEFSRDFAKWQGQAPTRYRSRAGGDS